MRLWIMSLVALAMLAPIAAQAETISITIDNFTFMPNTITIHPNTTVVWINRDDSPHTVVGPGTPPAFRSSALDTDDQYSYVFDKPGTYPYFCGLHPFMQGSIEVK